MGGENMMLDFAPNTYMLEYQNGAYLCNGTKQIEVMYFNGWGMAEKIRMFG